jgi:hypothetical protein
MSSSTTPSRTSLSARSSPTTCAPSLTGQAISTEFPPVVPGDLTVTAAHDMCDRVEVAIKAAVADVIVTIHVEPEHKAKHTGIVVLFGGAIDHGSDWNL